MRLFLSILFCCLTMNVCLAQSSDNGDGTFTNPVLWADMPDPDVIQVGDTFYFVSTSMHMLPGVTILKSKDLVNWEFGTNVVPQFDDDPYFDMEGGNRYGKGQWATAIRYWGGEFHVLFTSNSNGCFIYSSADMKGPWRKTTVAGFPYHPILDRFNPLKEEIDDDGTNHHILYDPGFLVDNDGRVYVVHGNSINYITEIDPVTCQAKGPARLFYRAHREGLEGNRLYHIGNYYYAICTYGGSHSGNVTCLRARSLEGPWEEREVMCVGARRPEMRILQACLLQLESGETWAMAFLDMGVLGRIPHLVPVYWVDEWPMFGIGLEGNLTLRKPRVAKEQTTPIEKPSTQTLATSDDFASPDLGLQWQFNHNPVKGSYSLTARPGWLRMHSLKANLPLPAKRANNPLVNNGLPISETSVTVSAEAPFLMARGVLTQRLFGPTSSGTAHVDMSHLKTGDCAGLGLLNIPSAMLSVSRKGNQFVLCQKETDNEKETTFGAVNLTKEQASSFWLRVEANGITGLANFSYSLDGNVFLPIGREFHMVYSGVYFVGNRFALFCYNTKSTKGGWMDVDDFNVDIAPLFDRHIAKGSVLEAEWTDQLWRTECRWNTSSTQVSNMDIAWVQDGGIIAFKNMQLKEAISRLSFTLRNVSGNNVFIELRDAVNHQVLGTADIPETSTDYTNVNLSLKEPLRGDCSLEIRVWNHDWDQPCMGEVLIDKILFE